MFVTVTVTENEPISSSPYETVYVTVYTPLFVALSVSPSAVSPSAVSPFSEILAA